MGMNLNNRLLVEKGIFSKEEFLEMVRVTHRELNKARRG
jgi:flagellar biosynthesis/type III secretory pathway chaperone